MFFRELVNTEKSYFENLSAIDKGLCFPTTKILTEDEHKLVFSNLSILVAAHNKFFEILKKELKDWSTTSLVGKIFLNHTQFITQYESYLTNYVSSLVYLVAYKKKKPDFTQVFSKFEESQAETTMLKTPSFLIMPVQRIPRYILLLRDIHKYTWESSEDYLLLKEAISNLDSELQKINSKIEPTLYPRMKKVLDALESIDGFTGDILNQDRELLREGPLHLKKSKKKTKAKEKVKRKQAYSFLFNDIYLFCSIITEGNTNLKYLTQGMIEIKQITAIATEGQTNIQVSFESSGVTINWILSTTTPEDRDQWLSLFQSAHNSSKHFVKKSQ